MLALEESPRNIGWYVTVGSQLFPLLRINGRFYSQTYRRATDLEMEGGETSEGSLGTGS